MPLTETTPRLALPALPVKAFWITFLPQLIAAPVLFFTLVTFLHEAAHAVAALAVGGRVVELSFLPAGGKLGFVRWIAPPGADALDHALVGVAPYVMWFAIAALVLLIAWRARAMHWLAASSLFAWGYAVPLGDIAFNLFAGHGDLAVGGLAGVAVRVVGSALLVGAYLLGFFVQRRLFGPRAVDVAGYLLSTLVLGLAFAVAAGAGLALFGALG